MKKNQIILLSLFAISFFNCSKSKELKKEIFKADYTDFKGSIESENGTITLDSNKIYNLTAGLIVKKGAKLVIPAGTVIKASGGTSSYIAVEQGGKIFINGNEDKPVIMTSSKSTPAPADWGGLVICGKAPTNKGATATSEVADLTYGGTISNDSSGSIKYLRIEYTGATFNGSKEFNGVSLFGVGSGTTFEYVQSYKGGDDGIEFFGGTVNGKYLISTGAGDDGIDFADGWSGKGENWFINDFAKAGIEGSNNGDDGNMKPVTNVTLKNISIVKGAAVAKEGAIYLKEGAGRWNASNVYVSGVSLGFKIKSSDVVANKNVKDGNIIFNPIQFSASVTNKSQYVGTKKFYTEGNNTGAGNSGNKPSWANKWTRGL